MALEVKRNIRLNLHKDEAIADVLAQERVQLTVRIPKSIHSEFRIAALRNDVSMTDLIVKWIREYI